MAIKICGYNVEWFDDLFTSDNQMESSAAAQGRFAALRDVLLAIDADVIGVVEAPNTTTTTGVKSTVKCLETFATWAGIRASKALIGFVSPGRQELAFLFDQTKVTLTHSPAGSAGSKSNPRFDERFEYDTDEDRIKETYEFYRPPLEATLQVTATGASYRVMLVHPKSKGIFSAVDMLHWERENLRNRRKLFAECTWIRRHVDQWLDEGHEVIVLGDVNDGPGMDAYEFEFARSAVEIIMGDLFEPDRALRNRAGRPSWTSSGWSPSSARFTDRMTESPINVLIDHIMVSQGVTVAGTDAHQIWNPFRNDLAKPLKSELLTASDHFPVTLAIA